MEKKNYSDALSKTPENNNNKKLFSNNCVVSLRSFVDNDKARCLFWPATDLSQLLEYLIRKQLNSRTRKKTY